MKYSEPETKTAYRFVLSRLYEKVGFKPEKKQKIDGKEVFKIEAPAAPLIVLCPTKTYLKLLSNA